MTSGERLWEDILKRKWFFIPAFFYLLMGWIVFFAFSKEQSFLWFSRLHHKNLDIFFSTITLMGDGWFAFICFLLMLRLKKRQSWELFFSVLISSVIVQILKHTVFNDVYRPKRHFAEVGMSIREIPGVEQYMNNSFPSGHSTTAFALFSSLCFLVTIRRFDFLLFLFALIACLSRVYLGQHFFNDTVAGGTLGLFCSILMHYYFRKRIKNPSLDLEMR